MEKQPDYVEQLKEKIVNWISQMDERQLEITYRVIRGLLHKD